MSSDRALEDRDLYGDFGQAAYEECQKRLREGYRRLYQSDEARASRSYRRWHFVRRYVEGTMSLEELIQKLQEEIRGIELNSEI